LWEFAFNFRSRGGHTSSAPPQVFLFLIQTPQTVLALPVRCRRLCVSLLSIDVNFQNWAACHRVVPSQFLVYLSTDYDMHFQVHAWDVCRLLSLLKRRRERLSSPRSSLYQTDRHRWPFHRQRQTKTVRPNRKSTNFVILISNLSYRMSSLASRANLQRRLRRTGSEDKKPTRGRTGKVVKPSTSNYRLCCVRTLILIFKVSTVFALGRFDRASVCRSNE
jgi:hypothetical protein